MSPNLNKLLTALVKELTAEVTQRVTTQLRETYVDDVTAIVKECLNSNQIYQDSSLGYITIDAICAKYQVSRKTVTDKCTLFQISRKKAGRQKLVNEKEFLEALQRPVERPKFLKNRKAA